jgi:bacterioferritin (cytochrome b1)
VQLLKLKEGKDLKEMMENSHRETVNGIKSLNEQIRKIELQEKPADHIGKMRQEIDNALKTPLEHIHKDMMKNKEEINNLKKSVISSEATHKQVTDKILQALSQMQTPNSYQLPRVPQYSKSKTIRDLPSSQAEIVLVEDGQESDVDENSVTSDNHRSAYERRPPRVRNELKSRDDDKTTANSVTLNNHRSDYERRPPD